MTNTNWNNSKYGNWDDWGKGTGKGCHTGNTVVYKEPDGGDLMIGGWNNDAYFDWNTHVIDLTGNEYKFQDMPIAYDKESEKFFQFVPQPFAGWLSLPFPDYKTPKNLSTLIQWKGMADLIRDILKTGKDVLVACHAGHGRSGLFCAIVGYILNIDTDRSWSSPVEKIRQVHCSQAVETLEQEEYVYRILNLNIKITRTYVQKTTNDGRKFSAKYIPCPLCGTQSIYVETNGMCLGCQTKYNDAPERTDLTEDDLNNQLKHDCTSTNCLGIWKASICKHIVHDTLICDGYCQSCFEQIEEERAYAEKAMGEKKSGEVCAVCKYETAYANKYGICYECAEAIGTQGLADTVHNSITDPYRALPHHCEDATCVGIMIADKCKHVVHNREIEDGICPHCQSLREEAK